MCIATPHDQERIYVFACMKDGSRTLLFEETGDFNVDAWVAENKQSLLMLRVKRIETETIKTGGNRGPH